jgi:hypothetical protein
LADQSTRPRSEKRRARPYMHCIEIPTNGSRRERSSTITPCQANVEQCFSLRARSCRRSTRRPYRPCWSQKRPSSPADKALYRKRQDILPARTRRVLDHLDHLKARSGALASFELDNPASERCSEVSADEAGGNGRHVGPSRGAPLLTKHPDPGPVPFEPVGWQASNGVLSQMDDVCHSESGPIRPMPSRWNSSKDGARSVSPAHGRFPHPRRSGRESQRQFAGKCIPGSFRLGWAVA